MTQRNITCTHQMLDFGADISQAQNLHHEHCVVFGNRVDFPSSNIRPVFSAPGSTSSLNFRFLAAHHDPTAFYASHYSHLYRDHSVAGFDLDGSASSNASYNCCIDGPSSSRNSSVPYNYEYPDHFASSSNHAVSGVSLDDHDNSRFNHFFDNGRMSCKRKTTGFPGTGSAAPSSSWSVSGPSSFHQFERSFEPRMGLNEVPMVYNSLEHRGSENLPITDEFSWRSVRSRSGTANIQFGSMSLQRQNPLLHGNYPGQPSYAVRNEHYASNVDERGYWHYAHPLPCMNENIGNVGGHGYHEHIAGRNSGLLLPSSSGNHHYNYRGQSYCNNNQGHESSRGGASSSFEMLGSGSRVPRSFSSNNDRNYRPHRRMPQGAYEDINARLRLLSPEDLAVLEFSGFYGGGSFVDEHRDLRLDIDDMSYEELLELEERIGDVSTGLSEEMIAKYLKIQLHRATSSSIGKTSEMVAEDETCIICQVEYKERESIGILDCGHQYHADCVKQWLLLKNVCPICKMTALSVDKQD